MKNFIGLLLLGIIQVGHFRRLQMDLNAHQTRRNEKERNAYKIVREASGKERHISMSISPRKNKDSQTPSVPSKVVWIRFLVSVNVTDTNCKAAVATPPLVPGKMYPYDSPHAIRVGQCDRGPLNFNLTTDSAGRQIVSLLFYSHTIEDASPPTCEIPFRSAYRVPARPGPDNAILDGCYVQDSREGWHLTFYWFYILDWMFA